MDGAKNLFEKNWDFSESHLSDIGKVLQLNFDKIVKIEVAGREDDLKKSTDLKIKVHSGDVAVRIRRNIPWRELTIRAYCHGYKTEIDKLKEGYADWYLYLWTDASDKICDWILVDIHLMRQFGLLDKDKAIKMNYDGTGWVAFTQDELNEANAIIAKHPSNTKI